ncbi:hypothetical protein JKP88DRAFT_205906 [Tribonema minus]|uniref:histidine kinase n=1 Tax=Tribonema minus TaxID=303371 RepID=A0A835ZB83_9STRA|nr:hypothetical protein JKP88DRAFT_205906 [Tribonema minus]
MLVGLFAAFILLCGITHLFAFMHKINVQGIEFADVLFRITCAVVSVVTAVVLALMLPLLLQVEVTKRGLPREALTRYEMIMRHSLDVISTHESLSGSCSFLSVSPSVTRLMGYSVDELLGRPLFDFVSRRDYARVVNELNTIVKGHTAAMQSGLADLRYHADTTTTIEYRLRCKDGERKCVETGVSIGMEGQGTVLVLVTRDVGERKAQEMERRERENLQMSMAVRQQYISSIAHDLKTPISTFQLALDLLGSTQLDEEQAVLVTQAKVATEFMSVTIFQAMDFARMAADGTMKSLVPRKSPTNLRVLVDKCAAVLDGYPKQVPITFVVSADVAMEVLVDGDWIWQMLINLCTNACKFTADGNISLRISIVHPPLGLPHFLLDKDDSHCRIANAENGPFFMPGALLGGVLDPEAAMGRDFLLFEVQDSGVGIPDKSKPALFQAFGQAQRFQSQGTGLGLYSVAQKVSCSAQSSW